jgi:hypothetical protein
MYICKKNSMTEIVIKGNIAPSKMEALIDFLQSWDMEVEIKNTKAKKNVKQGELPLSIGIWCDYNVDADSLRKQAWLRQ